MPTPQNYSFIAIAVSAALASMVFPSQAAWVDVDSLPSSGLVSQLPPELQAIIPAQASTGFTKVGTMPNYVYQWNTGTIPVYGNGLTLNGPGAEAFEHTVTVIQNSGTGIRLSSAIVHILLLPATVRRGCVPDKAVR